jgi:hypothetical protein
MRPILLGLNARKWNSVLIKIWIQTWQAKEWKQRRDKANLRWPSGIWNALKNPWDSTSHKETSEGSPGEEESRESVLKSTQPPGTYSIANSTGMFSLVSCRRSSGTQWPTLSTLRETRWWPWMWSMRWSAKVEHSLATSEGLKLLTILSSWSYC